jgi:orotate phosphoribosyltransferase
MTSRTAVRFSSSNSTPTGNAVLTKTEALDVFKSSGALLDGHFVLTSGRHASQYFEKFDVLRNPRHAESLCADLAERLAPFSPEVILGPTTLGVLIAYEVAKQLGVVAAFGEKGPDNSRFLRRPDHIAAGARVAVVDDILTTGGSVVECLHLCTARNATAVAAGVLVDRSGGTAEETLGLPLVATLSLTVQSWSPDEVPDWLSAIDLTRPGSTGKK